MVDLLVSLRNYKIWCEFKEEGEGEGQGQGEGEGEKQKDGDDISTFEFWISP